MGVGCSRCGRGHRSRASSYAPSERRKDAILPDSEHDEKTEHFTLSNLDEEREEAMTRLREDFKQRPTVFLLNQILLTVQFFKNFEKDRQRMYQLKQEKEDELNKTLRKEKKSVIYLGSPYEVIGENMEYCRSDNDEPRLGHDLDYLIVHDNISVRSQFEDEEPDTNSEYKFLMQKVTNNGFARLRQLGRLTPPGSHHRALAVAHAEDPPAPAHVVLERQRQRQQRNGTQPADGRSPTKPPGASNTECTQEEGAADGGDGAQAEGNTLRDPDNAPQGGNNPAELSSDHDNADGEDRDFHLQKNSGKGQAFLDRLKRKVKGDNNADINLSDEDLSTDGNLSADNLSGDNASGDNLNGNNLPGDQTSDSHDGALSENDSVKITIGTPSQDRKDLPAQPAAPLPPQNAAGSPAVHPGIPQSSPPNPFPNGQMVPGYFGFHIYPGMPGVPNPYQMNPGVHPSLSESPEDPAQAQSTPASGSYPQYPQPVYAPYLHMAPGIYPHPQLAGWPPNPQASYPPPQVYPPNMFGMVGYPGYPSPLMSTPEHGRRMEDLTDSPNSGMGRNSRENGKRGTRAKRQSGRNGLLKPPSDRRGRHRTRRSLGGGTISDTGSDPRRGSNASSKNSLMTAQDSTTTTDEETEIPGRVPRHCFRKVRVRVDEDDVDDDDGWVEPRFEIHRFLSAEIFLNHFTDTFPRLACLMEQEVWLEQGGRSYLRGPAINCREELRGKAGLVANARVIPTLLVNSWPAEMTFEWGMRRRPVKVDDRLKIRYVWPPQRVIDSVLHEIGCNLVPQGSELGTGKGLEWEVGFQQAEIKLISSLDLVHIHCWAAAKLFYTHFLAEFGCIKERHIRHLMFWQFERNFRDWRFDSLGDAFVEFITQLKETVQERRLPHYFIVKRNLLNTKSISTMVSAQEKIQRVLENLLPNVIILLSRLRIREGAFPTFDWATLYENLRLTRTGMMQKLIPELGMGEEEPEHRDSLIFNPKLAYGGDEENENIWDLSNRERTEARYRRWLSLQQSRNRQPTRRVSELPPRRTGVMPTFADFGVRLNLLTPDFLPRTTIVLQLFIDHFTRMAERLLKYGSIEVSLMYVDHALNLCTLLSEQGSTPEADEHREKLHELQTQIAAELPSTPQEVETPAVDPDLLVLSGGGSHQDNWTVGHAGGRRIRTNFNESGKNFNVSAEVHDAHQGTEEHNVLTNSAFFAGDSLDGVTRTNPLTGISQDEAPPSPGAVTRQTSKAGIRGEKARSTSGKRTNGSSGDATTRTSVTSKEQETLGAPIKATVYPTAVVQERGSFSSRGSTNADVVKEKSDSLLSQKAQNSDIESKGNMSINENLVMDGDDSATDKTVDKRPELEESGVPSISGIVENGTAAKSPIEITLEEEDAETEHEDTAC